MKKSTTFVRADNAGTSRGLGCYGYPSVFAYAYFTGLRLEGPDLLYTPGNGRRAYSASLSRFCQSDTLSPFRQGGINSYAYCLGDPVNRQDVTGMASILSRLRHVLGRPFRTKAPKNLYAPGKARRLSSATILDNDQEIHLGDELTRYRDSVYFNRSFPLNDETALRQLKRGKDYIFVMSAEGEIRASRWDWRHHTPTHAVLAEQIRNDAEVIAAGELRRKDKALIRLFNQSGHYRPPFESLYYPAEVLSSKGMRVQLKKWVEPDFPRR
ncbi:RHS repeat-associated core domain-containing protein [Pseudomonas sp. DC3000-4b1]|uniref:RHS repeat-associated core domain-containing protein n=1 Tax=unclassified Pseudomonas TaxID=196821 RepID=UPI003CEFC1F0